MKISICASAIRPRTWMRCYDSLRNNDVEWELIFVGSERPNFGLPNNFKYIYSPVKPAQCYEIAFREAKGELLSWTADDSTYPDHALDQMYNFWKSFNDEKIVAAFRTVEDGNDITHVHRLRGRDMTAPVMAPFGVMSTKLFHQLGGYDRRFICGQSENDVVMRVYEIGGRVEISPIPVMVNHKEAHSEGTVFRSNFYHEDRMVLENSWIRDGIVQTRRIDPVESFSNEDILNTTQSQKGCWK